MEFRHELVIPNEDIPFRMFIFEGAKGGYSVAKHWHRSLEIFALMEGEIDFYINADSFRLDREHPLLLVNSNEIHSIDAPRENRIVVLQIPVDFYQAYGDGGLIRFRQLDGRRDEEIWRLAVEMYQTYEEKSRAYELKVQSQLLMLLYLLVSRRQVEGVDKAELKLHRQLDRLSEVTSYIDQNYSQELSLETVAECFGFSPTYLSKMFQKYAKINYRTYLRNIRVEYGFKELVNTSHTISQVAYNNGFPNSKAFSKAFLERYGMLPSEYRRKIGCEHGRGGSGKCMKTDMQ